MAATRKKAAPKIEVSCLGGDKSQYLASVEGKEIVCHYNDSELARFAAMPGEDAGSGCRRWIGAVRREFAIAASNALFERNLRGNLVYTVPANEGLDDGRLVSGIIVGMSFGGQLFEMTASVTFDVEALEGEDPLGVVRENCEIAARSLVESVLASRMQP